MHNQKIRETYVIPLLLIIFSLAISCFSKNSILGLSILIFGLLNGWYAAIGKWYNYLFASVFTLLNAYVSWKSGLYGIAILSMILYFPLQLQGLFDWYVSRGKDNKVKIRGFNTKISVLIITSCFAGSISLGCILSKVPNQQLAFLDSTSNVMNICAIILMNLRFRECWWILLGNNVVDLMIWIINFSLGIANSLTMLVVSIAYLLLNIIAIIKWKKEKSSHD